MKLDVDHLARLLGPWSIGPGTLSGRLAERLGELIDDGALGDGTVLPTERALSDSLGISRGTAASAYRILRHGQRLESRQGSGTRVRLPAGSPGGTRGANAMLRNLGSVPDHTVDLALAETRVGAATIELLADLPADWLASAAAGTGYHPAGLPALRDALAGLLPTWGVPATPDGIVVTTGAQQAIALAAQVWCPPGGTVLVEEATFPGALEAFRRLGQSVVGVPVDASGPVPEALDELARRHRPSLAYLVPVGGNPTGITTDPRRLEQIASVLDRHRLPVIDDRTPAPLATTARTPAGLATMLPASTVITVGSSSKIAWAGLRTGWAVAHPDIAAELVAARLGSDLSGSLVSQLLSLHLVPRLDELAARARADVARSLDALCDAVATLLPDWSFARPPAGAWLWVRTGRPDAVTLTDVARSHGVLVTPGPAFSPDARCADHIRLAAVEPPELIREGVARLAEAWAVHTRQTLRPARLPSLVI